MKIRVILYCIFLCAITFVGCDKQEEDVLISTTLNSPPNDLVFETCEVPIQVTKFNLPNDCLSNTPYLIGAHSYIEGTDPQAGMHSEPYDLTFVILKTEDYKDGYQVSGGSDLNSPFFFTGDIIWTVTKSSTEGHFPGEESTVYNGTEFTHTFTERTIYFISCKIELCSLESGSGGVLEDLLDFCISRPSDYGADQGIRIIDLNGNPLEVRFHCGNIEDTSCGTGSNGLTAVVP